MKNAPVQLTDLNYTEIDFLYLSHKIVLASQSVAISDDKTV